MNDIKSMIVQRTHSQTMGLFSPFFDERQIKWRVVAVCRVRDEHTINRWMRQGAKRHFVTWDWKRP